MRRAAPAIAALLLSSTAFAGATEGREETAARAIDARSKDPAKLLEIKTKESGSPTLISGSVKAYAEARKLLSRGQPAAALKALAKSSGELFDDREALLKGDALLALGEQRKAKAAYLEAIEKSQLESVSVAAARGLINVLMLLKERDDALLYLDALLDKPNIPRRPNLLLQRAMLLLELDRPQEAADYAWRVVRDFPSSKVALQAGTVLDKLKKRGVKVPAPTTRVDLARIRNLISASDWRRAEQEMDKLQKAQPKLAQAIDLLRAEMYRKRRMKPEEYEVLSRLYDAGGLSKDEGVEVLSRLGKIALGRDDVANAQKFFDELEAKYPNESETAEGQYLAAWLPYNTGDYDGAIERMLRFASTYRKSPNRPEALWFAGWAAYLAHKDGLARRAFEQLLEEHPNSELRPQARYWIGKIRQRSGDEAGARTAYREVLAMAPLSYWGFWSIARLKELGEEVVLNAPPPTTLAPLAQVVAMLGPKRPINVDRAIALHTAELRDDALDELSAANSYLKSVKDTLGRTMVADLLQTLGAHYLAYRVGASIAQDGADLVTGKPHAWRAWRHAYPRAFEPECTAASAAHELDIDLILSIMRTESSFRPNVRSPVGAWGLMQLMPGTAQQIGRSAKDGRAHAARFKNPDSNVWLGSWYLSRLIKRYGGQLAPAIGAYNAGPGAMDKWIEQFGGLELDEFIERVPYRETRRYIRRVLETYMVYRRLNGEPLLELRGKVTDRLDPEGSVSF